MAEVCTVCGSEMEEHQKYVGTDPTTDEDYFMGNGTYYCRQCQNKFQSMVHEQELKKLKDAVGKNIVIIKYSETIYYDHISKSQPVEKVDSEKFFGILEKVEDFMIVVSGKTFSLIPRFTEGRSRYEGVSKYSWYIEVICEDKMMYTNKIC